MSDDFGRNVGGPRPRPAARRVEGATSLIKSNRGPAPQPPADDAVSTPELAIATESVQPVAEAAPAEVQPATELAPAPEVTTQPEPVDPVLPFLAADERTPSRRYGPKFTIPTDEETQDRANAALRLLRMRGGQDITKRDWLLNAIMAEILRVERDYNGGEPLVGDGKKLRAGRPVGS